MRDGTDDYEEKTGSVVAVEPGRLLVRVERTEDCGGCHTCAVRALCRGKDSGHMELPVGFDGAAPAKEGDRVRIAYRPTNAAVASLVMFVPALLGLFLGGLTSYELAPENDGALLIGCLAGFAAGILVSYLLSRTVAGLKPDVKLLTP